MTALPTASHLHASLLLLLFLSHSGRASSSRSVRSHIVRARHPAGLPQSIRGGATSSLRRRRNRFSRSRLPQKVGALRRPSYATLAFFDPTSAAASLSALARRSPYATAFVSCAINGAAADWTAQSSESLRNRKRAEAEAEATCAAVVAAASNETNDLTLEDIATVASTKASPPSSAVPVPIPRGGILSQYDFKRSLAFILYGGCYQGMALELIYNDLFTRAFGAKRVLLKVAVSQFLLAPLVTLPVAYVFKGLVFGKSLVGSLQDYWHGVTDRGLLLSFWKLWIPIQFLVFAVIPVHLRIPFSAFFSFLWTVMLSRISSS